MDLDIRIRLATATDAERIAQLLDRFRRELGREAQASVPLPVHQDGPQYVLLCEVCGAEPEQAHAVGVASLQRCHHLVRGNNFLLLTDIYVLEEYRRHGVAVAALVCDITAVVARRLRATSRRPSRSYAVMPHPSRSSVR